MRHVINHQVVPSQAPEGPLATWLDKFADAASRQGYTRSSICRRIRLAAGFSRWLGQERIDLSCINSQHPAQYLRYRMDLLQAGVDRAVIALWLDIIGRDHVLYRTLSRQVLPDCTERISHNAPPSSDAMSCGPNRVKPLRGSFAALRPSG